MYKTALINEFTDMANRGTLLTGTSQQDLLSQIVGTIIKVSENKNNDNKLKLTSLIDLIDTNIKVGVKFLKCSEDSSDIFHEDIFVHFKDTDKLKNSIIYKNIIDDNYDFIKISLYDNEIVLLVYYS